MIKLNLSNEKINEEDLLSLESELNIKLPDSYKELMLENNGGVPLKNYFKGEYGIASFHPIKIEPNDLKSVFESFKDLLPSTLLAFADDMGGNSYCIDISEENNGKVYFIDWDEPDDPEFLANSFEEFLEGLTDTKEDF